MDTKKLLNLIGDTVQDCDTKLQTICFATGFYAFLCTVIFACVTYYEPDVDWSELYATIPYPKEYGLYSIEGLLVALTWLFTFIEGCFYYKLYKMNQELAHTKPEKSIKNADLLWLVICTFLFGSWNIISCFLDEDTSTTLVLVIAASIIAYVVFLFRVAKGINTKWNAKYGILNLPYSPGKVMKWYAIVWLIIAVITGYYRTIGNVVATNIMGVIGLCLDTMFFVAIACISVPRLRESLLSEEHTPQEANNEEKSGDKDESIQQKNEI